MLTGKKWPAPADLLIGLKLTSYEPLAERKTPGASRFPPGISLVELRVPYREAAIVSNRSSLTSELKAACKLIPGDLDIYPQAYPRR
jgi:hypothetical protein